MNGFRYYGQALIKHALSLNPLCRGIGKEGALYKKKHSQVNSY